MTKPNKRNRDNRREHIRLDQAMQQLFKLSRRVTLRLIEGLFGDRFAEADVTDIQYEDNRFTSGGGQQLRGDLYLAIRTRNGVVRYHIEFQTRHDRAMAIRMFRYGLEKAIQESEGAAGEIVVEFPKQLVIYVEENGSIADSLTMLLQFADGQQLQYRVPVMKYWTLTAEELFARGLYALLPLQIFNVRVKLKRLARSNKGDEVKRRHIAEQFGQLQETVRKTLHMLDELYDGGELQFSDLEQMMRIVTYIAEHLYAHYDPYQQWNAEVDQMIKSLIDPKIWQEGKKEGRKEGKVEGKLEGKIEGKIEVARNLLSLGVDAALIREATGLSEAELEQLL